MAHLQLKISDLITKDSLEYRSLTDPNKSGSIANTAKYGLRIDKENLRGGGQRTNHLRQTTPTDNTENNSADDGLKIPLSDVKILHFDGVEIIDEGGLLKEGQTIFETLDCYAPDNTYTKIRYDYIKNLAPWRLHNLFDLKNYCKRLYFSLPSPKLKDPKIPKILCFCPWFSNMYHFLFEALPRLLILLEYMQKEGIEDFYIIAPPRYRAYAKYHRWYIQDIFTMLNIPQDKIIYLGYQVAAANNIYATTSPRCNPHYVLPAIHKLQKHFYQKDFPHLGSRIYISRKKSAYRYLANEEEIYEILHKEYGFVRVYMEDFSLGEKINIMMGAAITISIDGTSAINSCFMTHPNAKMIALRAYEMSELQLFIPSMFENIQYLPIICDIHDKIGENIWSRSNLYLKPDYLRQKLQEYKIACTP
ncbi:hypothetical protein BKH46_04800 [Helicobacter sp. 12S02634-8]|uniref:glycosyltransferase family 61 protein n=1 Tax=Helicobacter sp. 12S02634-8 TaxID=1476199 RepID=UPI000BA76BCE|nr:glycosyltransferase family 61 protein [Helicobacter sp. 12S02634-8]PAF47043.1 hypothetical protein BKH46_04800 [Helicobacter sp. 12S02634-8]